MKAARFAIVEGILFKKSFSRPLLRCVSKSEANEVLSAIHSGLCGNHSGGRSLAHKAITVGFGLPKSLTMDNGTQFNNLKIECFCEMYGITMNYSPVYHPQANRMAEATNKAIVGNIRRNLEDKKGVWLKELPKVLWAQKTTKRRATDESL
ncbi:hypothetical protein UlMin_023050 [Ulmus minor]